MSDPDLKYELKYAEEDRIEALRQLRKAEERIRELELRLASAHIIEMHPEHHGRCIKEINALKADRDQLKTERDRYRIALCTIRYTKAPLSRADLIQYIEDALKG